VKAADALTYDKNVTPNRLYFRGIDGGLYYYRANSIINYDFSLCQQANLRLVTQSLRIAGNLGIFSNGVDTKIYFVGTSLINGTHYIHCLTNFSNSLSWDTVSPSFSAAIYNGQPLGSQLQSNFLGEIAVSPDGNTIAFFAETFMVGGMPTKRVAFFHNINGWNFSYNLIRQTYGSHFFPSGDNNSLQFKSNNEMFFISPSNHQNVNKIVFKPNDCANVAVTNFPP
jgi:hypothetical protein